jgi:hypothetical protein
MRISKLTVKHLLGIEELSIDCGRITEIQGRNGSSKTSILQALQAAIGGGDLNNLKRVGAEGDAEIALVLDEGVYKVARKGKETKVEKRVRDTAAYEDVRRPQTFLDSLYDAQLSNPIRFLSAQPNTRADLLLQVLAGDLDVPALTEAIGADLWPTVAPIVHAGGHPLPVLAAVRAALYNERTGVNATREDKARTAKTLMPEIPAHMPDEVDADLPKLERERDELHERITAAKADAESTAREAHAQARSEYEAAAAGLEAEFKTYAAKRRSALAVAIAEVAKKLTAEAEAEIAVEQETANAALDHAEELRNKTQTIADQKRTEALSAIEGDQARFNEVAARVAKHRSESDRLAELRKTKSMAEQFEADAESLKGKSKRLSEGIEAVDVFKAEMLNALPIEGLTVEGKEIKVNGVPFDQLNTATKIKLAVGIAELRAKKHTLPVLFIDGAEALDSEQYQILLREVEATGCQAFVSRVTDGPLKVTPHKEEARASA